MTKAPWALLASGVLGVVSLGGFAPFYLFPVPVVTLALLLRLWQLRPPGFCAVTAFVFGLGFFGAGVSWIYTALHEFGGMQAPIALVVVVLFACLLASFLALVGYLQAHIRVGPASRATLVVPALWVLSEWARSWFATGFPWLAFGYSQVPASPIAGFGPVGGVLGMSLCVSLSAGIVTLASCGTGSMQESRARRWRWCALLLVVWLTGLALKHAHWTEPVGKPVAASLLQGNIAQDFKWQPAAVQATLETYGRLAVQSSGQLIVFPETALPLFWGELPHDYIEQLSRRTQRDGADMLIGIPERSADGRYFNSLVTIGGTPSQVYRKHHLVALGEYIPMRPLFGWALNALRMPLSDFSRGGSEQQSLSVAGQKVAALICYEDAFGAELIRRIRDASLLVNVSNDAWFGDSIALWQHFQVSQAIALTTGRPLLRATNTGITGLIGSDGRALTIARQGESLVLNVQTRGYQGATPYVRWGDKFVVVLCLLLLLGAWLTRDATACDGI